MEAKKIIIGALIIITALAGCKKKEEGNASLVFKVSNSIALKSSLVSNITISDFTINLREVEFGYDEDMMQMQLGIDSCYSDIELKGPFKFDLVKNGVLNKIDLGIFDLPIGYYEEVEFDLDTYMTEPTSEMYGHSILVKGMIGTNPFVFWHNAEDEIEIEFPDYTSRAVDLEMVKFYVDFHMDKIISLFANHLGLAVDRNMNGVVEIGPDDPDGNSDLAGFLFEIILESCDLDDDNDNTNDL